MSYDPNASVNQSQVLNQFSRQHEPAKGSPTRRSSQDRVLGEGGKDGKSMNRAGAQSGSRKLGGASLQDPFGAGKATGTTDVGDTPYDEG